MFEYLLDREEASLKKNKTFLFCIVPEQPGQCLARRLE